MGLFCHIYHWLPLDQQEPGDSLFPAKYQRVKLLRSESEASVDWKLSHAQPPREFNALFARHDFLTIASGRRPRLSWNS